MILTNIYNQQIGKCVGVCVGENGERGDTHTYTNQNENEGINNLEKASVSH